MPSGRLGSEHGRIIYDALRYRADAGILGGVIKSFADAETALIWSGRRSRRLPLEKQPAALRKLRMLH